MKDYEAEYTDKQGDKLIDLLLLLSDVRTARTTCIELCPDMCSHHSL